MNGERPPVNILRDWLARDDGVVPLNLAEQFETIEAAALESWVPLLGQDGGSHSGPTHLQGVERHICSLVEHHIVEPLTSSEAFVLLCGILFHDVGRVLKKRLDGTSQTHDFEELLKSLRLVRGKNYFESVSDDARKYPATERLRKKPHHALISADLLMMKWEAFRLPDRRIAESIATLCAAHDVTLASFLRTERRIDDQFLDRYGRIRLGWLCALLALGDELDNSFLRAAPDWYRHGRGASRPGSEARFSNDVQVAKGEFRAQLLGCEVDLDGQLLVIHPNVRTCKRFGEGKLNETIFNLLDDLRNKKKLLNCWFHELRQMHLYLFDAAVSIGGELWGIPRNRKPIVFIREPDGKIPKGTMTLVPLDAIASRFKGGREEGVHTLSANKRAFELLVEPLVRRMKFDQVLDAALTIRFSSMGKNTFPWATLATEAGIEKVSDVRLIFHRMAMLARHYYELVTKDKVDKPETAQFVFIELDGEWTVKVHRVDDERASVLDSQKVHGDLVKLYDWICREVFHARGEQTQEIPALCYEICNENLAYLFDENGSYKLTKKKEVDENGKELVWAAPVDKPPLTIAGNAYTNPLPGIILPASVSPLFRGKRAHAQGLNLVITGPPGVGKSTLAMELIARTRVHACTPPKKRRGGRTHVGSAFEIKNYADAKQHAAVYLSLEQPTESIRQLSERSGIPSACVVSDFHHADRHEGQTSSISDVPPYFTAYREILEAALAAKEALDTTNRGRGSREILENPCAEELRRDALPLLVMPKVPSRTYGTEDDDRLFWFRYRQISRLIEAHEEWHREAPSQQVILSHIVIDNLNAFARTPLARQRIHQLFKLITWSGVLGVHIVEWPDDDSPTPFSTEVEFLADAVVRLYWKKGPDYWTKYMNVAKARGQRHVLGQHPFKISAREPIGADPGVKRPLTGRPSVTIFRSLHTQVSRWEKAPEASASDAPADIQFARNTKLNFMVQKNRTVDQSDEPAVFDEETAIPPDALVVLRGKPGGHKLALGLNYLHQLKSGEAGLVINMGQSIKYSNVAGAGDC